MPDPQDPMNNQITVGRAGGTRKEGRGQGGEGRAGVGGGGGCAGVKRYQVPSAIIMSDITLVHTRAPG